MTDLSLTISVVSVAVAVMTRPVQVTVAEEVRISVVGSPDIRPFRILRTIEMPAVTPSVRRMPTARRLAAPFVMTVLPTVRRFNPRRISPFTLV